MSEYDTREALTFKYWADYGKKSVTRKWNQGRILRRPKELFLTGATEIDYTPLLGPSWIRLLTIEPGKPGAVLRCSLRSVDLEQHPRYAALSYTWKKDPSWLQAGKIMAKEAIKQTLRGERLQVEVPEDTGDLKRTETIVCNGKICKVYPNLYDGLVQLRQREPTDYWIDALCINQSDSSERAAQVQMMGPIYRSAELVIVWLGKCSQAGTIGIAGLEALAKYEGDLPDYAKLLADDIIVCPPGLGIEAKALYDAWSSTIVLIMCQWFKRVWVLQELCLAQQVVYILHDTELSSQAILTAFNLTKEFSDFYIDDNKDKDDIDLKSIGAKFSPIWAPQIQHDFDFKTYRHPSQTLRILILQVPMTLQARETFREDGMWTLRQWLWACRGRAATDPRDLLFGGLSLIQPELLRVDQTILAAEISPLRIVRKRLLTLRNYYPQAIPSCGMKNAREASREQVAVSSTEPFSLIPEGLWPVLKADYTVDNAEVFVNIAACLLSQSGIAELLSLATRMRHPSIYASKWWLAPTDKIIVEELPSWVPTPGSWASRLNESLAFRTSSGFAASVEFRNPPKISIDGTALFLDTNRFDQVETVILDVESIRNLNIDQLKDILSSIERLSPVYHGSRRSSFGALSRVLLSGQMIDSYNNAQDASRWLCQTLTTTVADCVSKKRVELLYNRPLRYDHAEMTNDEFVEWLDKNHGTQHKEVDDLIEIFEQVRAKHSRQPWPRDMNPRSIDRSIHFFHTSLETPLDRPQTELEPAAEDGRNINWLQNFREKWIGDLLTEKGKKEKFNNYLKKMHKPIVWELYDRFEAAASSALAWRKVFITRRGYFGLGPKWLAEGDWVMLVHGAPVPYIFTELDKDLSTLERAIRSAMDKNNNDYNQALHNKRTNKKSRISPLSVITHNRWEGKMKRLDGEMPKLQQQLDKVGREIGRQDAWVLLGEAYIEGIMHGEAAQRRYSERITVV